MRLKDQLGAMSQKLRQEEFVVPEWENVTVWLRVLPADEKSAYELRMIDARERNTMTKVANHKAWFVAKCLVDANGDRTVPDDQIGWLGQQDTNAVDRLYLRCCQMNSLNDPAAAAEQAAKNSNSGPSDGSPIASPQNSDG